MEKMIRLLNEIEEKANNIVEGAAEKKAELYEGYQAIASSPLVVQEPAQYKGVFQSLFHNTNPIHIEIGTGKGRFIIEQARLHPEINYLGIDKKKGGGKASPSMTVLWPRVGKIKINSGYFLRAENLGDGFCIQT